MAKVRVLVGTRKGAFVITADGTRRDWKVDGPHFGGWEVMHLKGSPVNPDRIFASQWTDWHGQVVQRSDDGGSTWEAVGNEFAYEGDPGTHQWYDGTPHPWDFKRVWHFEPSPRDPDTVFAGVEDAALFRSRDGGKTWEKRDHGMTVHDVYSLASSVVAGKARLYAGTQPAHLAAAAGDGVEDQPGEKAQHGDDRHTANQDCGREARHETGLVEDLGDVQQRFGWDTTPVQTDPTGLGRQL